MPPHHRKHIRLRNHDYNFGSYFITMVTRGREPFFGTIKHGEMQPNELGQVAINTWKAIPQHLPHVAIGEVIVMPDHIHGIILLHQDSRPPELDQPKRVNQFGPQLPQSLGVCIGQYKSSVTRILRKSGFHDFGWQPRYYDRYIRNLEEIARIREYIKENPKNWEKDPLYWKNAH